MVVVILGREIGTSSCHHPPSSTGSRRNRNSSSSRITSTFTPRILRRQQQQQVWKRRFYTLWCPLQHPYRLNSIRIVFYLVVTIILHPTTTWWWCMSTAVPLPTHPNIMIRSLKLFHPPSLLVPPSNQMKNHRYHRDSSSIVRTATTLFWYHDPNNHHHNYYNSRRPYERRLSFTTSSSPSSNRSTTKRKDSWRKQIHVSDDVPVSNASSRMNDTTIVPNKKLQFHDTPLGKNGMHLLDGLDHYTVYANDDGHPLSVYGIQSEPIPTTTGSSTTTTTPNQEASIPTRKPILLLHGRTWSSVPVYHLLGGPFTKIQESQESRSLMEALLAKGLQPYCMDFRGFGGTHMDTTQCVEPYRCVQDAETVLQWIQQRHSSAATTATTTVEEHTNHLPGNESNPHSHSSHNICNDETAIPALLGWSQGALVAQLVAQRNFHPLHPTITTTSSMAKPLLSKLILYGSIYDPLVRYPREPLYVSSNHSSSKQKESTTTRPSQWNTYDAAIEDFTVEGTIPPEPARLFAEAALLSDPVKVVWKNLYQFNNCDPARVHVPCLVIAGDQDPYAPLHVQQELFCNLARASDRTWSILSGSDHACHLLDGRDRLINTVVSFVMNGKRTEPRF